MSTLTGLLAIVYTVCAVLLTFFTLGQIVLLLAYVMFRHRVTPAPTVEDSALPSVAVQLPVYNEKHVITRLLEAVAALDYPRDKLMVQVLDDSTDDTIALIAETVSRLRGEGLNIHHGRRENRTGYKAGALQHGLELLPHHVQFAAIVDADFVPPPDFLMKTIPYFGTDPKLAIIQTRWGHLNADDNLLTRAQALAIDAHFVVEQTARNRSGLLLTFNGTGGIWRIAAIRDSGGWSADTLTEDFDLSYRAQLRGWRYLYLPEVVVPGEIPPQIDAYKRQQARWAKGSTQVLFKLIVPVWRTPGLTLMQRLMATYHLCQYLPHPLMITLLLLSVPLLNARVLDDLPLAALGLVGLFPPLMHVVTQHLLNQRMRLIFFPALMILGTGLAWNNTRADFSAIRSLITGKTGEFIRTPKFARGWQNSAYAAQGDNSMWVELGLAAYAVLATVLAWRVFPAVVPFLGLYAVSFGVVGMMSMADRWRLWMRRRHIPRSRYRTAPEGKTQR